MGIGERIKTVRKGKYTQAELAEQLGVHETTIRRWESGRDDGPKERMLGKLAAALGTTVAYLTGEIDDPAPGSLQRITYPASVSNLRPLRGKSVEVPVIAPQSSICCGRGFDLSDVEAEVIRLELVPEEWLTGEHGERPYYITYIEGDSMEPVIQDGERILVNPNQRVMNGDVAVVCWNDRSMVKGVTFERNGDIRLISMNKSYPEITVTKEDAPYVLSYRGVVVRALGKDRIIRGFVQ